LRHNHFLTGSLLALVLGVLVGTDSFAQIRPAGPDLQDQKDKKDQNNKKDRKDTKPIPDAKIKHADLPEQEGPVFHKLTIQTGQTKTVAYFPKYGASQSDQSALRELERAENEAILASDLFNLKQQYVATERALEPKRRIEQLRYYGLDVETNTKATNKVTGYSPYFPIDGTGAYTPYLSGGINTGFGNGLFGAGSGIGRFLQAAIGPAGATPGALGGIGNLERAASIFPYINAALTPGGVSIGWNPFGPTGFAGGPYGFGYPGYGSPYGGFYGYPYGTYANLADVDSFNLSTDTKMQHSLKNGIGPEGAFKTALVAELAKQATPDYLNSAAQRLETALASVPGAVKAVRDEDLPVVNVILKDNEKINGRLAYKSPEWVRVRTPDGEVELRTSEVVRIYYPKAKPK